MPKFQMTELVADKDIKSARLGSGTAQAWDDKEVGKPVKLVADSRYDLCATGDPIEGFVTTVGPESLDNYSFGSVQKGGRKTVIADGLQATPGTGTIAVGDFVVASTAVAKGTALASPPYPKVTKATQQPGVTEAGVVGDVNDQLKVALNPWRVVAIHNAGTGAVGDTLVIERHS